MSARATAAAMSPAWSEAPQADAMPSETEAMPSERGTANRKRAAEAERSPRLGRETGWIRSKSFNIPVSSGASVAGRSAAVGHGVLRY
ncbi:hypothetical protein SVIO_054280 [Streptomyces violaceusniger]|uniref:Uncharacterized protein n=1 Tax=Streptomyces violaceusniger TaxID=68280 RepID=A0A4D4L0W4_STRVO|nr:hypothetical protein SVIO_054280 [Streptomyces violaceusniger]